MWKSSCVDVRCEMDGGSAVADVMLKGKERGRETGRLSRLKISA
jgi:hypothetical protein